MSDKKARKALKNTKKAVIGRFWKTSKYIEADFKEDLEKLIEVYSEKGHRDARVLDHSFTWNDDNTLNLDISVEEGKKYIFGDIRKIDNYSAESLRGIFAKHISTNAEVLTDEWTG